MCFSTEPVTSRRHRDVGVRTHLVGDGVQPGLHAFEPILQREVQCRTLSRSLIPEAFPLRHLHAEVKREPGLAHLRRAAENADARRDQCLHAELRLREPDVPECDRIEFDEVVNFVSHVIPPFGWWK